MNAKRLPNSIALRKTYALDSTHLRYLSPTQKQKALTLSKDWKIFTYGIYGDIFDKI